MNLHARVAFRSPPALWGAVLCCVLLPARASAAELQLEQPPAMEQPKTLQFSFSYQEWSNVLRWFAEQADLSLVLDTVPPGTFNYTDNRKYSPGEAIDLLNSVLLTKGYTLVRRDRMLLVINLEDGIPPNLISTVPLEDLDKRGEFELVSVVFPLEKLSPDEAEAEISKLIGPQGTAVALPKSRQVMVTETAGRLRVIRSMLERIENPQGAATGKLRSFELRFALPEEVLPVIRKLSGIAEDADAAADGSIRLAVDPAGNRLLVTGQPEKVAQVEEILEAIDLPGPGQSDTDPVTVESPQLEIYPVDTADPESVLAVMQTLLAGMPDVRLAIDAKTNNLVALARPSQHATIRATLDQMQRARRMVEVIRLRTVDPQVAVLSINKLFSEPSGTSDKTSAGGPQVDADPITRQLLVRGTQAQIEQIRTLLEKMGEAETGGDALAERSTLRVLPLQGRAAQAALQRAREIWPSLRANQIRVVAPSAAIPTLRPSTPPSGRSGPPDLPQPALPAPHQAQPPDPAQPTPGDGDRPSPPSTSPTTTRWSAPVRVFFVAQSAEAAPPTRRPPAAPEIESPFVPEEPTGMAQSDRLPAIVVVPGPGGVMIASQDVQALDDFEELLHAVAGEMMTGNAELTVFYLKHAKATVVAETLNRIFGGGIAPSGTSQGRTPAGGRSQGRTTPAAAAVPSPAAMDGILGSMLARGVGGLSIMPTGSVSITPDARLNALIVRANPADVATVQQLLEVLDQRESPEDVLAASKARMIPVFNTQAEEVASIVKEVYRDRLVSGSNGAGGSGTPNPQQFFQAMRGMRGRTGTQVKEEEKEKMSVGVDTRTNSLVVVAPDALFQEIKQLVEQLDEAALDSSQTMRVVTLSRASAAAVQGALAAMLGDSVQTSGQSGNRRPTSRSSSGSTPSSPQPFFRPPLGGFQPGGTLLNQPASRWQGTGPPTGGRPSGRSRRGGSRR